MLVSFRYCYCGTTDWQPLKRLGADGEQQNDKLALSPKLIYTKQEQEHGEPAKLSPCPYAVQKTAGFPHNDAQYILYIANCSPLSTARSNDIPSNSLFRESIFYFYFFAIVL